MRKILVVLLLSIVCFSCGTANLSNQKVNDKMVGIWKGFEKDKQIEGVEKHWIQERFKDGTYIILFTSIENCEVQTFVEKGKWWLEEGKFYEISNGSKEADVYHYEIKDDLVVKFKSIKMSGKDVDTYIFEDYKVVD